MVYPCWACGAPNDDVTGVTTTSHTPKDGDASVCFHCAVIGVFTGNGYEQRQPTEAELAEISESPQVRFMQRMILSQRVLERWIRG